MNQNDGDTSGNKKKYIKLKNGLYRCNGCKAFFYDRRSAWTHYERKHVAKYYENERRAAYEKSILVDIYTLFPLILDDIAQSNQNRMRAGILDYCRTLQENGTTKKDILYMLDMILRMDHYTLSKRLSRASRYWWRMGYSSYEEMRERILFACTLTTSDLALIHKKFKSARDILATEFSNT